jgi:hypothetical protein
MVPDAAAMPMRDRTRMAACWSAPAAQSRESARFAAFACLLPVGEMLYKNLTGLFESEREPH